MVTVFLHCWQRTEQHQENLQEQRCTTSARPALYPGPQHTSSQPSGASREVPGVCWKKATSFSVTDLISRKLVCLFCHWSYHCISSQQSQGYRCQGQDGRNPERVKGTRGLWQQGVWPGGHEEAVLFWILFESDGPKDKMVLEVWLWTFSRFWIRLWCFSWSILFHLWNFVVSWSSVLIPLWLHQSVPWAQRRHVWMEAWPSSKSSTHRSPRRHGTYTLPACCEGWPEDKRTMNPLLEEQIHSVLIVNRAAIHVLQVLYQPSDQPRYYGDSLVGVLLTAPWLVLVHPQMFGRKPHHRTGCHCTLTTENLLCVRETNQFACIIVAMKQVHNFWTLKHKSTMSHTLELSAPTLWYIWHHRHGCFACDKWW